jgi:flavin-binding protein dodecin
VTEGTHTDIFWSVKSWSPLTPSWEEAGRRAVETAATSIRDLRVAEVVKMDMKVEDGKVTAFRTRVALSFKYETS